MQDTARTILVQGASRGLGLEFVRQLLARDEVEKLLATCRDPGSAADLASLQEQDPRVRVFSLDVEDEASIRAVSREAGEEVSQIDLLINCAGILHDNELVAPERRVSDIEPAALHKSFAINAVGPALVVKHFLALLQKSAKPVVANLSARVGSITDNRLGGWYGYRMSKAAQNMLTRSLAVELGRGARKVTVVALHPGTVDTDLSRPFQANVPEGKLFSRERAVRQLLDILAGVSIDDSGRFFAWDGSEIPW